MQNPLYADINSASARSEARRVWESLRPEAVSSHARQRWLDGAEAIAKRMLEHTLLIEATACAEWQRSLWTNMGYAKIYVGKIQHLGHRLAWELFVGEIDAPCVLHKCDNRRCINPAHLFPGTRSDNSKDMWAKGRNALLQGEQVKQSKLSTEQVLAIRARYKARSKLDNTSAIARDYGMSQQQIYSIVTRRDWAWLPDVGGTQPTADAPAPASTAP